MTAARDFRRMADEGKVVVAVPFEGDVHVIGWPAVEEMEEDLYHEDDDKRAEFLIGFMQVAYEMASAR